MCQANIARPLTEPIHAGLVVQDFEGVVDKQLLGRLVPGFFRVELLTRLERKH